MKTITIVADDRVGLLADMSYVLGKAKIDKKKKEIELEL